MTQVCAKTALTLVMPAGLIYEENHTSLWVNYCLKHYGRLGSMLGWQGYKLKLLLVKFIAWE